MIAKSRITVSEAWTVLRPRTRAKSALCCPFDFFPVPIVSSARPNRRCASRDSAHLPTSRYAVHAVFPAIARVFYAGHPPDQRFQTARALSASPEALSMDRLSGQPEPAGGRPGASQAAWVRCFEGAGARLSCSGIQGPAGGERGGGGAPGCGG